MSSGFLAPKNEYLKHRKDQIDAHFLCHCNHRRWNAKMISPFSSTFPKNLVASAEQNMHMFFDQRRGPEFTVIAYNM